MYQLLFLVHGMGAGARPANDPTWWTGVLTNLRASARAHGHAADFVTASPKAGQVLVVPLTYHELFDDIRTKWTKDGGGEAAFTTLLRGLLDDAGANSASVRVPSWAASAGDFFWTHVLDVILYRYIADFTIPIRESVALQIATAWHQADIDNGAKTTVHFLSHSLGTAVLHDAICLLGSDSGFGPGTHKIRTMVTCANVSAILENGFPPYSSIDRPTSASPAPGGMTEAYYSFRHELDPIAAVHAFRADQNGWPSSGYKDSIPIDVKDWNVHGYSHYLDNPTVHFRLFERMWTNEDWASRREPAIQKYRASAGTACPVAIAKARADLRAILADPWPPQNEIGLIELASRTMGVLSAARSACAGEANS
jgi:hypothetical protein